MGRLELAGIDPYRTPPARFWRALWALFVEYKATFNTEDADEGVRRLWALVAGQEAPPLTDGNTATPAVTSGPTAPPRVITNVEIDPETGQPRRPTAAEREAWAKAYSSSGPLADDAARGRGAAPRVGAPERA